jgi:quercetin dioxygenase-like cupin family protein
MSFIDTASLGVVERLPGWRGRMFHSPSMTFVHYEFDAGAAIHEHHHAQEEVWTVLEGELEVTIDGVAGVARAGMVAVAPPNARHAVRALSRGRAIVVDTPLRWEAGERDG